MSTTGASASSPTTTTDAAPAPASTSALETTTSTKDESTSTTDVPVGHELITEGTIRMIYPKDTNAVFYNPVQVQNRDLSVLMIRLYSERRAKRRSMKRKRKELVREATSKAAASEQAKVDMDEIQRKLDEYESSTDWTDVVATQQQRLSNTTSAASNGNDNDNDELDGLDILDALAASGLRSLRYWNEIPGVRSVTINDLDPVAVELAKENAAFNGLSDALLSPDDDNNDCGSDDGDGGSGGENKKNTNDKGKRKSGIRIQCSDATHTMYVHRRPPNLHRTNYTPTQLRQRDQYDVIDLDPYGSAAPFLDAAIQSIVSGGLLCVTCTDMAALGGSHPETCYGRYGAMPIPRSRYLQELALRILLGTMSTIAGRYGRTIRPILSVGMAFYVRVFVEVHDDKAGVNRASLNMGTVYQSTQCPSFHVVPHGRYGNAKQTIYQPNRAPPVPACEETGAPFKIGGPAWIGPLHDFDVVDEAVRRLEEEAKQGKESKPDGSGGGGGDGSGGDDRKSGKNHPLQTRDRLHGLLTAVSEELSDVPLYYTLPDLCHTLGCEMPPMVVIRAALTNAGHRVSAYHKEAQALKTDAPNRIVWDVMRAWCRDHPPAGGGGGKKRRKKKRKRDDGTASGGAGEGSAGENVGGDEDGEPLDPGAKILAVEPSIDVDFTVPKGFEKRKKAQRYPMNPEPHWGPKKAASGRNRKRKDAPTED